MSKRISLLGSTGSIGRQSLEVIEALGHEVTALTAFMDQLQQKYRFGRWFFGSYHQNRIVPPKYCCLFDRVVPGEPKKKRRKKG